MKPSYHCFMIWVKFKTLWHKNWKEHTNIKHFTILQVSLSGTCLWEKAEVCEGRVENYGENLWIGCLLKWERCKFMFIFRPMSFVLPMRNILTLRRIKLGKILINKITRLSACILRFSDEHSRAKMLQNQTFFEVWHDTTSGKFHMWNSMMV